MATMYSQVVFPQTTTGFVFGPAANGAVSYAGIAPATATQAGAIVSPTWNPASAAAADRTQWWPDSAGTMSYSEVMVAAHGLSGIVSNQISSQIPALQAAIETDVSLTIGGTAYTFSLTKNTQSLNLLHGNISNLAKMTAGTWASGATVAQGTVINVSGEYYQATVGGACGTTEPTFPAASLTSVPTVADGAVTWEVVEFPTPLANGGILYLNVANLEALFTAVRSMVATNYATYNSMVNNLTAISQSISAWTASASVPANSYLVVAGNIYKSGTTAGTTGATLPTFSTAVSSTTTDNTVTWTCIGDLMTYINSQVF